MMRKAIISPDSFKGTFTAAEVAAAIAAGVREAGLAALELPVADGGEGTMDALLAKGGDRRPARVSGPLGEAVEASYGLLPGADVAVVEMAQASGLVLVPADARDPWRASTRGTGELIVAAAASGAERILVSVGGSATTDGGRGALEALAGAASLPPLTVLCDVETPWEDAARVFAPQKGADAEMVQRLSGRLEQMATELGRDPRGVPMTGCAGGLSGGLWAEHGAELVSGAQFVLDTLDFDQHLREAAFVVTGEGSLDSQSFAGKVVSVVAERSSRAGVPCHAVVGRSALDEAQQQRLGLAGVIEAPTAEAQRLAGRKLAAEALA
ncbi:MAG TPA: glycerate kinase [Solirubrobacterales bacterium]|nr:glycerate kinase [Solirubrobacterales bacterium]